MLVARSCCLVVTFILHAAASQMYNTGVCEHDRCENPTPVFAAFSSMLCFTNHDKA
jgi:hypothetical protein